MLFYTLVLLSTYTSECLPGDTYIFIMRLLFFAFFLTLTASEKTSKNVSVDKTCQDMGDCVSNCEEKCGCDRFVSKAYVYNETTKECQLNLKYLMNLMVEKFNNQEKIRAEAEHVFSGIMIAALFFISCAAICACSACVYCVRINYVDYNLNSDVKALAKKLGRDKQRKPDKTKLKPEAESCNVIVEEAGLFVM